MGTVTTCQIFGSELEVGDELLYLGDFRRVAAIEAYTPSDTPAARDLFERLGGPGTRVALWSDGQGITVSAADRLTVVDARRGSIDTRRAS